MSGMQLKCRIKETEYEANLVQGATFSDEYNETLDSGTIIISNVSKIIDLKPYDDVYIYTGEYTGYQPPVYEVKEEKVNVEASVESKSSLLIFKTKTLRIHKDILNGRDAIVIFNFVGLNGDSFKTVFGVKSNDNNTISLRYKWGQRPDLSITLTLTGDYYVFSQTVTALASIFWLKNMEAYYYRDVEINVPGINTNPSKTFYKHLLVNQFNEEYVNLNGIYKYKIELFSETKKLETVQLPNISVTQPLKMYGKDNDGNAIKLKKTVWEYLYNFVNMYSPKIRVVDDSNKKTWKYVNKYVIDYSLKSIFDKVYCPDFSLNNPNLRDVLSKLMIVKDYIPYVEDDVIKGLDITQRRGAFNVDLGSINFVSATMASGDYASNLRRGYSGALSQDNSAKMIEYLGFRNSDNALMTIENMRLETRFPIYKINKIYMCYYKKGKMVNFKPGSTSLDNDIVNGEVYDSNNNKIGDVTGECVFLCKQDITKLVKLDSERNLLSQDWSTLKNANTIDELAKYKIATVGYSIGSNYITGWGERFEYPFDNNYWFTKEKTYLQKLAEFMDSKYPYGIYNNEYFTNALGDGNYFLLPQNNSVLENIETVFDSQEMTTWAGKIFDAFSGTFCDEDHPTVAAALRLKSFFFEIDYQAFYNGAVVHSKDGAVDDITINDNSSSSLTLLEQDGLFQKEKINRYGNKNITIPARYKYYYDENNNLISPISQLQGLGTVYERDDEEDVIIYHREYQIFENEIRCTYVGSKDYVLKNYFTSVYAKHRTYNLMSYGESVRRSENKKTTLLLSKNKAYYDDDKNRGLSFKNFYSNEDYVSSFFNAFKPDEEPVHKNDFKKDDIINYAYIEFKDTKYLSDLNTFVSGNSMCFNLTMFDNVSMGVFISKAEPEYKFEISNDYVGSVQDWAMTVDSSETGFAKKMGFYVGHIDKKKYFSDKPQNKDNFNTENVYYKLLNMPVAIDDVQESNVIYTDEFVLKDNKEVIDMTFQVEPISENSDIIFSNWLMKLSSLISTRNKIGKNWVIKDYINVPSLSIKLKIGYMGYRDVTVFGGISDEHVYPYIFFKLSPSELLMLQTQENYYCNVPLLLFETEGISGVRYYRSLQILIQSVKTVSSDEVVFTAHFDKIEAFRSVWGGGDSYYPSSGDDDFIFKKVYTDNSNNIYFACGQPDIDFSSEDTRYNGMEYFSNMIQENKIKYNLIYPEDMYLRIFDYVSNYQVDFSFLEDILTQDYSLDIYNSESTTLDKTYYKNMWLVLDKNPMEKTIVYDELVYSDFGNAAGDTRWRSHYDVEEHFELRNDDIIPKIRIKLRNNWNSFGYKSIQYWFLDREDDSDNDNYNGSYKFVFGINVTQEDYTRGYVDVYISDISNKNKNVYNENRVKVGSLYDFGANPWGLINKANVYYDESALGIIVGENELISHMTYELNHDFKISTLNLCEVSFNCYYKITTSLGEIINIGPVTLIYGSLVETMFNSPNDINIAKVEILSNQGATLKTYVNGAIQGSDLSLYISMNSGFHIENSSDVSTDLYVITKDFLGTQLSTPSTVYIASGEQSDFITVNNSDANYIKVFIYDFFNNLIKQEIYSTDDVILPIVSIISVGVVQGNLRYILRIENKNSFAVNLIQKISDVVSSSSVAADSYIDINVVFTTNSDQKIYLQFIDLQDNYSQVWYGILSMNSGFKTVSVADIETLDFVDSSDIVCYADFSNSKVFVYNKTGSAITAQKIALVDDSNNVLYNYLNVTLEDNRIYNINTNNDDISSCQSVKLRFYLESLYTISFEKTCTPSDTNMIAQYDKTRSVYLNVTGDYSDNTFNLSIQNTSSLYNANIGEISVGVVNGGGVSNSPRENIFIPSRGGTYTYAFTVSSPSSSPIIRVTLYDSWGDEISTKTFNTN